MATKCPQCKKGSRMVNHRVLLRGHYNPTGKKRKYPNLQWARVDGKRIKICTDCIKTQNKTTKKLTPVKTEAPVQSTA